MARNQTLAHQRANIDQNGEFITGTATLERLEASSLGTTLVHLRQAGYMVQSEETARALETEIKASALCIDAGAQAQAILTASIATREYVPPDLKLRYPGQSIQDLRVVNAPFSAQILQHIVLKGEMTVPDWDTSGLDKETCLLYAVDLPETRKALTAAPYTS